MASDGSNQEAIENTKQQIRGLVSEIAQLAKSELEPGEFYAAFMQKIVSALAAHGGAAEAGAAPSPSMALSVMPSDATSADGDGSSAVTPINDTDVAGASTLGALDACVERLLSSSS